jgi:hypothetical protein
MRGLALILALFWLAPATAQMSPFQQQFFQAGEQHNPVPFYTFLSSVQPKTALEKAYKGAALAMYADVADGVSNKFSYFNQGKALLEEAVKEDFYNPEIRFLRYSIQSEVPIFVGYRHAIDEDVWRIIGTFQNNPAAAQTPFWNKAIRYMLSGDELDTNQRKELQKLAA